MLGRALRFAGIGLVLAVLAFGAFFQGLFFWTALLFALAVLAVGALLWLAGRLISNLPLVPNGGAGGVFLWLLLGSYVLQFAWAIYPRGNLDWVLRAAGAILVYYMLRAEASARVQRWLLLALTVSAFGVAAIGLAEYAGYPVSNLLSLEVLPRGHDGLTSTFQYHNSASIYLLCGLLAAVGLCLEEDTHWVLALTLGFISSFLTVGFFFGVSRGAFTVLPLALLAFLLGLDSEKRVPAVSLLVSLALPVMLSLSGVSRAALARDAGSAMLWCSFAGVVAAIAWSGVTHMHVSFGRLSSGILVGVLTALLVSFTLLSSTDVVPAIANRLGSTYVGESSVSSRLVFARDALEIFMKHPKGLGGWGWARTYQRFQETPYISREAHNHYAQTLVEVGVPGLLGLVMAIGVTMAASWRCRRGAPGGWALASAGLALAAHAGLDFSLSYGTLWLLLWSVLAVSSVERPGDVEEYLEPDADVDSVQAVVEPGRSGRLVEVGLWSLGVAVMGLSLLLLPGSIYADRAEAAVRAGDSQEALLWAERSLRYDSWNSAAYTVVDSVWSLTQAARLDPSNPQVRYQLAIRMEVTGDIEGALTQSRAAIRLRPLYPEYYSKALALIGLHLNADLHYARTAQALTRAAEIMSLSVELRDRLNGSGGSGYAPGSSRYALGSLPLSPTARLRLAQALYLTGDDAQALPLLRAAARVGLLNSEAELWLYALYERQGNTAGLKQLESRPWVRFRNQNPIYLAIKTK